MAELRTIDDLIAALEQSEWPMSIYRRAELDSAIHRLVGRPKDAPPLTHDAVPDYVGSIDAALKLMPADAFWTLGIGYRQTYVGVCFAGDLRGCAESPHRPSIALCIAALKARKP